MAFPIDSEETTISVGQISDAEKIGVPIQLTQGQEEVLAI